MGADAVMLMLMLMIMLRWCAMVMRCRPRVDLPLGPGLFEVRSALKAVDEINKLPMPMLFMCKSANRAGA